MHVLPNKTNRDESHRHDDEGQLHKGNTYIDRVHVLDERTRVSSGAWGCAANTAESATDSADGATCMADSVTYTTDSATYTADSATYVQHIKLTVTQLSSGSSCIEATEETAEDLIESSHTYMLHLFLPPNEGSILLVCIQENVLMRGDTYVSIDSTHTCVQIHTRI